MYLYALTRCLYIFTIGYAFKKNRKLVSNMCEIFGYQKIKEMLDPSIRTTIPAVAISDIVDDDLPIQLRETAWADGNISLLELTVIIKLLKRHGPKKIFEIGTFDGRTTLNLACNSAEDAVVWTLDLPKKAGLPSQPAGLAADSSFVGKADTGARFHASACGRKITQLFGDSAAFDFLPYENSIDFVFIDGAHTYEYLFNDTKKAMKLLKGGRGVIIWHDYSWVWPGVTKALNLLYESDPCFKSIRQIKGTSLVCYINTKSAEIVLGQSCPKSI